MKKFAYIVMGPSYQPKKHQATYITGGLTTSFFAVRDFEEAKERVKWCYNEGYKVLELCGAFGRQGAEELIALTDGEVGIGYVVHSPEQDKIFEQFFSGD